MTLSSVGRLVSRSMSNVPMSSSLTSPIVRRLLLVLTSQRRLRNLHRDQRECHLYPFLLLQVLLLYPTRWRFRSFMQRCLISHSFQWPSALLSPTFSSKLVFSVIQLISALSFVLSTIVVLQCLLPILGILCQSSRLILILWSLSTSPRME